jgi:flagellar biosynthesis/type III secretory pathway protein FliH
MQLWEEMAMSRQDGYSEGREAGHQEGYSEGREVGYGEGKKAGYGEGREAGYGEGREAGYGEGKEAGYGEGCARINILTKKLLADNRTEELLRALDDTAYQEQLLKEYHL